MSELNYTLRQAIDARIQVLATCASGHSYTVNLEDLMDLMTPYGRLDEVVLSRSWCPQCGALASSYQIRTLQ